ncbi:hypothetical protein H4Q32_025568 [Labeo rohita]|uniref:Reverse transcriptase domain-containing protein n=1 Tax=Labeo rohita TaxID=84645 RepID=A0ABQ8LA62_LABRO|nr:hypothetical protein H4Q32_025568 [Labeo rohita]
MRDRNLEMHPDRLEMKVRLSMFIVIGACAGLPALVWSVSDLIHHKKNGHRISVFIILLLLTDFVELLLSPYILIKHLLNEIGQNLSIETSQKPEEILVLLSLLINKVHLLGLNTSLCSWILDFLTARPQSVHVGRNTSSTTTLSTGAPRGCVLSPVLFMLLTDDCTAKFSSNHIIKFADDTTVVGLISNSDETPCREEVAQLVEWCGANNLSLNVSKTKEVVMDFRRNSVDHPPLTIDSSAVERVSSTKFLGVHITEDLIWTTNTMSLSKKANSAYTFSVG